MRLISEHSDTDRDGGWRRPRSFPDGSKDNDYWEFSQAGVDRMSPQLVLKNDGVVEFTNFDESSEPVLLSYREFLEKYRDLV